mmetsp:Transcript_29321/g.89744  ORF Transcript_29321/g.89744 Transcript_29321/m.89744 type:complete len:218 (-) Transcript_29321:12-665(-)
MNCLQGLHQSAAKRTPTKAALPTVASVLASSASNTPLAAAPPSNTRDPKMSPHTVSPLFALSIAAVAMECAHASTPSGGTHNLQNSAASARMSWPFACRNVSRRPSVSTFTSISTSGVSLSRRATATCSFSTTAHSAPSFSGTWRPHHSEITASRSSLASSNRKWTDRPSTSTIASNSTTCADATATNNDKEARQSAWWCITIGSNEDSKSLRGVSS